jgi:hypothetical protein
MNSWSFHKRRCTILFVTQTSPSLHQSPQTCEEREIAVRKQMLRQWGCWWNCSPLTRKLRSRGRVFHRRAVKGGMSTPRASAPEMGENHGCHLTLLESYLASGYPSSCDEEEDQQSAPPPMTQRQTMIFQVMICVGQIVFQGPRESKIHGFVHLSTKLYSTTASIDIEIGKQLLRCRMCGLIKMTCFAVHWRMPPMPPI